MFFSVAVMGLLINLCRLNQLFVPRGFPVLSIAAYSVPSIPDSLSKSAKIQSSIKLYLKRIHAHGKNISCLKEFPHRKYDRNGTGRF